LTRGLIASKLGSAAVSQRHDGKDK